MIKPLIGTVTAVLALFLAPAGALADELHQAAEGVVTSSPGSCPSGVTPGAATNCSTAEGTITGTPIVAGTFRAVSTTDTSGPLRPTSDPTIFCADFVSDVTLTDPATGSTILKRDVGETCGPFRPSLDNTYRASGTYTIIGGTGVYEGATGSGTFQFVQTGDQLTGSEDGNIYCTKPGQASRGKDKTKGGTKEPANTC